MRRRAFLSAAAMASVAMASPKPLRAATRSSEDVHLLGEILTTLHPGLYRYLGPTAFHAELRRLDRLWQEAPSLEARFVHLTAFLAQIRCGHTYPSFYNQSRAIAGQVFSRKDRLPFAFRWIGAAMVVTQLHADVVGLSIGSEVTAINGIPVAHILDRLLPLVRADGGNDGKRRALLSVKGTDDIETFDVLYGLCFGPPSKGIFHIRYRAPRAERDDTIALLPIDLTARQSFRRAGSPRADAPMWTWQMGTDGLAVLTMPNWAVYNSTWDWQAWLNDRLDSLTGARGLIVDLRANEGGNDCGDLILARLAGRDIPLPKVRRLVRYREVPAALNPYLETWDDSFRDWGPQAHPFDDQFFELMRAEDKNVVAARGPRITVPMVVLTSAQNSSATFQFANIVKSTGLGTLVGDATGGNRRGINGGAFFFVRLPESGLEFDLPLIGYFPQSRQPDAGILPDIPVRDRVADLLAGQDSAMQTARQVLLKS